MAPLSIVALTDALHLAHSRRASDLHVVVGLPPVLRIDGCLEYIEGPPLNAGDITEFARAIFSEGALKSLEIDGDVTVATSSEGNPIRVHGCRANGEIAIAVRFLQRCAPELGALKLPTSVADFTDQPHGLVIFAGPTGSGKSTTLASLVDRMNKYTSRKIIMIEDPIEYRFTSQSSVIVQREVGRDVRSFAKAVFGALRSDPDVIVIGEMRDPSTIAAAMTAAETGHLVLSTLHTGDATQSIDRIINAFPVEKAGFTRVRLAQVLVGVLAQRLIPLAKGYGRRALAEVLVANDAVRHVIRDGRHYQLKTIMATGRQFGMQTLESHLEELVQSGEVSVTIPGKFAPREHAS